MNAVIWGLCGCVGAMVGLMVWRATNPPRAIGWTPPNLSFDRWLVRADHWLRARWAPVTRQHAEILEMPPWQVVALYVAAGLGGGLVGLDLIHGIPGAVVLGGLAAWKGPSWLVSQQFQRRRHVLNRDLGPLVLLLRIYLDLGRPLPEALALSRPGLSRLARSELDRLLADITQGKRTVALKTWAKRSGVADYTILADTLAQGWDAGLSGATLSSLDTLIDAARDQGTRSLTDRLDGMASFLVPIAGLGVMLLVFTAMVLGGSHGAL